MKNSVPPTSVSSLGVEPAEEMRLRTIRVPVGVPSLAQSSRPSTPLLAAKKSVFPTAVRPPGLESPAPGLMSLTRTVPARVPSLFQSSLFVSRELLRAEKKRVPLTFVSSAGNESAAPPSLVLMFLTMRVPAAVPSLRHSSTPLTPSSAAK